MTTKDPLGESGVSRRDMLRLGAGGLGLGLFGGIGPVPPVFAQATRSVAANPTARFSSSSSGSAATTASTPSSPTATRLYYKHRPTIGIKESDVLKIDAQFGWHKSMRGMKNLYDEGKVAIVHGVGYDQPSFSHFTSISFWHTAAPNSGNEYGWVGRDGVEPRSDGCAREHDREHLRTARRSRSTARSTCRWCSSIPTTFQRGVFAQEKARTRYARRARRTGR